jgi:hypothetical protein
MIKKVKSKLEMPQMSFWHSAAGVSTRDGKRAQIRRELGIFTSSKKTRKLQTKNGKNILKEWRMNHYQNRCYFTV